VLEPAHCGDVHVEGGGAQIPLSLAHKPMHTYPSTHLDPSTPQMEISHPVYMQKGKTTIWYNVSQNAVHAPPATRNHIFRAVILPRREYCAAVWDPHQMTDKAALNNVQHLASWVVSGQQRSTTLSSKLAAP